LGEQGEDAEDDERDAENVADEVAARRMVGGVVGEKRVDVFHPGLRVGE